MTSDARADEQARLTGGCKLHFVGLLDYFRGLQDFEANHATVVAEIGNHPRTNLVTLLYARVPQRNGQRVRFFVIFSFHVAPHISRTSMSCKGLRRSVPSRSPPPRRATES